MTDDDERPPREHVEATVILPDYMLERFLDFCEEELGQLPDLEHVDPEDLGDRRALYELMASQEEDRLQAKVPASLRN